MKTLLRLTALLLILAAVSVALLARDARLQLERPLAVSAPTSVQLQPGRSLRSAIAMLDDQGLLANRRQAWYLEAWARWQKQAGAIHAGEYLIEPGMTPLGVLQLWVDGRVVLHELRVIEGTRAEQLFTAIAEHPAVAHSLQPLDAETAMTALGLSGRHPEGRFYPDTYRFARGTSDVELLRQAHQALTTVLAEEWGLRAPGLPMASADEALTLASIIEKETGLATERSAISGVFVRRLQLGMRLQTDPTVIYGIGERYDGNIRRSDLTTDTPYNTYTRAGLPPTPICLPGRAAIHAALHPEGGDSLYFVSRGDGSHQFSATLAEHEAAVRRHQLGKGG